MNTPTRRQFLAAAGIGALLSHRAGGAPAAAEKLGWQICAATYTFRRFSLFEALDMVAELGLHHIEPAFFLKLDAARPELQVNESLSSDLRRELRDRLASKDIHMTNFYGKVEADPAANRKIFEFAKDMGAKTIVAEPPAEAFDSIEPLCDEFAINLAIHNHPNDRPTSKYWNPDNVLAVVRNRGPRIGACCDIGHWVRSNLDPLQCLKKLQGRVVAMHLKDVAEAGNPQCRDVPLGTGKANYEALLRELHRQGFRGALTLEYEHDTPALMDDLRACLAFLDKAADALD